MKEPKINKLRFDPVETRRVRQIASKARSVKITVNIDATSLKLLKKEAQETGIPYQR